MADLTSIYLIIFGLLVLEIIMAIPVVVFVRLGGWPEGYYRITKQRYFGFVIYDPDGTPIRRVKKMKDIIIKSPPHFESFKKTFYVHSPNAERFHGRPQWRYTADNSLPIPMFTGKIEITLEDGTKIIRESNMQEKLDPRDIFKAYNTDIPSDLLKLGTPKKAKGPNWLMIGLVSILGLLGFFAGLYVLAHGVP